jgi:hypothetical protein
MRLKYAALWRDAAGYKDYFKFSDRVHSYVKMLTHECEMTGDPSHWATMKPGFRRGILEANVTAFMMRKEKLPNGVYIDPQNGRCLDLPGLHKLWQNGHGLDRTPRRENDNEKRRLALKEQRRNALRSKSVFMPSSPKTG